MAERLLLSDYHGIDQSATTVNGWKNDMTRTRKLKEDKVRTIRLVRSLAADGVGVLCVTVGEEVTLYAVREIVSEIGGRGFEVHRLGLGTQYHVLIGELEDSTCECMGFLRHGYCRHVLGLYALVRAGKI